MGRAFVSYAATATREELEGAVAAELVESLFSRDNTEPLPMLSSLVDAVTERDRALLGELERPGAREAAASTARSRNDRRRAGLRLRGLTLALAWFCLLNVAARPGRARCSPGRLPPARDGEQPRCGSACASSRRSRRAGLRRRIFLPSY